jgi:DNA-binding PadR family transcriptional regulator
MTSDLLMRLLFLGFVRVHILHHCATRSWYGQELRDELAEHGYRFSFGTLYPLLHAMEEEGWLRRTDRLHAGRWRKYYETTAAGRLVLRRAHAQVGELARELDEKPKPAANGGTRKGRMAAATSARRRRSRR